ncbi:MAG: hypothetical protein ACI841_000538 [Planctomycetota bacterium]
MGSVRREGQVVDVSAVPAQKIGLTVQAIDVETGVIVCTGSYLRDTGDALVDNNDLFTRSG